MLGCGVPWTKQRFSHSLPASQPRYDSGRYFGAAIDKMIDDTLLVSCPGTAGGLFLVNGLTCRRLSSRPMTGLCIGDGQFTVAYQDNSGRSVRLFRDGAAEEKVLGDEPMDIHDVLLHGGRIYAAVTEQNKVVRFDVELNVADAWVLPGEHDAAHLNSVVLYQDRLLASIFGRFQRHRQYKEGTQGLGEIVDIRSGLTFLSGLSQPHSLTVHDGLLFLCSSEDREIRAYCGQKLIQKTGVPGYARGLAVGSGKIYVGISLSRNAPVTEIGRDSAKIAVIDSSSWRVMEILELPAHEIYDIRIVNRDAWVFPHIIDDSIDNRNRELQEEIRLYKRGYESYMASHNAIVESLSWKIAKPVYRLERLIRKLL